MKELSGKVFNLLKGDFKNFLHNY